MLQSPVHASKAANSSFDADDDLDTDLAEELSRFRSPDAWSQVAQHLDLVWKIGRVSSRQQQSSSTGGYSITCLPTAVPALKASACIGASSALGRASGVGPSSAYGSCHSYSLKLAQTNHECFLANSRNPTSSS
jgi:hypothetical protein